jgi:hypothetical protein
MANNSATKKATVKSEDQLVLDRPRGVYTGDNQPKRKHQRSESASEIGAVPEYDVKKHRRALSLQPYMRDGTLTTNVKDWTPKSLDDGTYGSDAMEGLCEEFGKLAADIIQGFGEGK